MKNKTLLLFSFLFLLFVTSCEELTSYDVNNVAGTTWVDKKYSMSSISFGNTKTVTYLSLYTVIRFIDDETIVGIEYTTSEKVVTVGGISDTINNNSKRLITGTYNCANGLMDIYLIYDDGDILTAHDGEVSHNEIEFEDYKGNDIFDFNKFLHTDSDEYENIDTSFLY